MNKKINEKNLQATDKRSKLAAEIKRREYYNSLSPFPIYDTEIINDLKIYLMISKKENYNNVPISYCKTCLSIALKDVTFPRSDNSEPKDSQQPEALVGYCIPCGNTDIVEAHVEEWEEMYAEKYGEKFLDQK